MSDDITVQFGQVLRRNPQLAMKRTTNRFYGVTIEMRSDHMEASHIAGS